MQNYKLFRTQDSKISKRSSRESQLSVVYRVQSPPTRPVTHSCEHSQVKMDGLKGKLFNSTSLNSFNDDNGIILFVFLLLCLFVQLIGWLGFFFKFCFVLGSRLHWGRVVLRGYGDN